MNNLPDWVYSFPGAVTVANKELKIIYMNEAAATNWASKGGKTLIGGELIDCHNERSRSIIARLIKDGGTNVYTIEKAGKRKLIYQSDWKDQNGEICGLVEVSMVLPENMPHYVRS